jgi:hypothetical protein
MEIVNRKLVKWVFIVLVAATVLSQINEAFSQDRIKAGYPADAATRVATPTPIVTLHAVSGKNGNSQQQNRESLVPAAFRSHPEYGKVKQEGSPEAFELIQERTANSRTFVNPDGSFTKTQVSGRLHYKNEAGQWISIGRNPSANNRTAGEFGIVETDLPVVTNLNSGNCRMALKPQQFVEFSGQTKLEIANASQQVILSISSGKSFNGMPEGNKVTFNNYWSHIDRVHLFDADRLKTNYVIHELPSGIPSDGYLVFSEQITLPAGWVIKRSEGGAEQNQLWIGALEIVDDKGNAIGTFEALEYYDAGDSESVTGGYKISKSGNSYIVSVFVEGGYLKDPSLIFPVTIDPTLTGTYSSGNIGSSFNTYCNVNMNVTIPANSTVSSTTIVSNYNAIGTTKKKNGRIRYTGPGGTIGDYYCNENTNGICSLTTTSTTIANGFSATGVIPFTIGVMRNNNGSAACNSSNLYVPNNTWQITLTYTTCTTLTAGGTVTGNATSTCGQSLNYTCSGGSGAYQWEYSSDGGTTYAAISGATTSALTISFNTAGTYIVRVLRTTTGCTSSYSNTFSTVVSAPTVGVSTSAPFEITSLPYTGWHNTYCYSNAFSGTNNQATNAKFFKFTTGACTNKININTCDSTSIFDTYIFLLNASGTVLTSNDDYTGCTYLVAGNPFLSRIQDYTVTPNTVYYIVVQAYRYASPAAGTFGINVFEGAGGTVVPSVSISGGAAICQGGSVTLTANPTNGGSTPTYLWKVNGTSTGVTGSTFTSSSLNNGDVVTVTMTSSNSCASPTSATSAGYTAVVSAGPSVSLSSNSPLCDGADLMLNANISGSFTSVSWSGPASFASSDQNPVISGGTVANQGTYSVVVTGLNSCTTSANTTVAYSSAMSAAVSNTTNPTCGGNSDGSIEVTVSGGTSPFTYFWSDGQSAATAVNLAVGPYAVTIFDANGCTAYTEQELTAPATISGANAGPDREVCNLLSLQLEGSTPESGTGTWTLVSGQGTISDVNDPHATVSNLGTTVANVFKWSVTNGCQSFDDVVSLRVYSGPPPNQPVVSGPLRGCKGDTLSFSTNLVAPTLVWEARPEGQIISGQGTQNVQIIFGNTTFTGYHACVTGSNVCGSNVAKCMAIRTNTSVPKLLVAPVDVCDNTTVTYKSNTVGGALTYRWTGPAGITFNGSSSPYVTSDTTVSVYFPAGYTSAKIGVASAVGCQYSNTKEVTVSSTPLIPYAITGARGNLCNTEQTYYIRSRPGQTYQWNLPAGAVRTWISSGTDSIKVQFGTGVTGNITVKAVNICGNTGPERKLAVTTLPSTPGIITGPIEACPNTGGYIYSIADVPGASAYRWSLPAGAAIRSGDGTSTIEVEFGSVVGRISVQSIASCGISTARNLNITANCRTTQSSVAGNNNASSAVTESTKEFNLQAYPDAESKVLTITYNAPADGIYTFKLIDQTDREVHSGEFNAVKGSNMEQLDMSAFPNAVYRLEIQNESKKQQLNIRFF